ncbi:hypothetical protein V6O07_23245 [Arthrospira platensis SPKY2]
MIEVLPDTTPLLIRIDNKKDIQSINKLYNNNNEIEIWSGKSKYKNIDKVEIYSSEGWRKLNRIYKRKNKKDKGLILLETNKKVCITSKYGNYIKEGKKINIKERRY